MAKHNGDESLALALKDIACYILEATGAIAAHCGLVKDGVLRVDVSTCEKPPVRALPIDQHPALLAALQAEVPSEVDGLPASNGPAPVVVVPWRRDGETFGAALVEYSPGRGFPQHAAPPLTLAARQALQAFEHARRVVELERAGEGIERLVAHGGDALAAVDLDCRITAWSEAGERLTGWSAEEVLGRQMPGLRPSKRTRAVAVVRKCASSGRLEHRDLLIPKRDGSRLPARVTVVPLLDADARPVGLLAAIRPLCEGLGGQDEAFERFANEIKAASTSIAGYAQLLRRAGLNADAAIRGKIARSLEMRALEASALLDEMLLLARGPSGGSYLEMCETDVAALAARAAAIREEEGAGGGLLLEVDTSIGEVMVDARAVERALVRMLGAVAHERVAWLSVFLEDGKVVFDVSCREGGERRPLGHEDPRLALTRAVAEAHGGSVDLAERRLRMSLPLKRQVRWTEEAGA